MAVSKFGFGGIGFKVRKNTIEPGVNVRWLGGERFIVPALFEADLNYEYEFGEIVEIVGDTRTNYIVKPLDDKTTANSKLGVIMATMTGAQNIRTGVIRNGIPNVTLEVWLLDENLGGIGVAFKGDKAAATIGGAVFIGTGEATTVRGAVYPAAVTGGTITSNLVFQKLPNTPSETNALSVQIGRKL